MYDVAALFKEPEHSASLIVAEIGINHNGDVKQALELVTLAVDSGADAVKFQIFKSDNFINPRVSPEAYKVFQEYELTPADFDKIQDFCRKKDILFFATPLDGFSLEYSISSKLPLIKVASSDIATEPLLSKLAAVNIPVILSSGMADDRDIERALSFFEYKNVAVLYCVSEYPAPAAHIDLNVIAGWSKKWNIPLGFSDHSTGVELSEASIVAGARIIERHFTYDKTASGGDHAISLDPVEFSRMVKEIRNIESALGSGVKIISDNEKEILAVSRKALYAARGIKQGEIITEKDIFCMRPGPGISLDDYQSLIGKKAERDFALYEKI